jgi:hypothetical protein
MNDSLSISYEHLGQIGDGRKDGDLHKSGADMYLRTKGKWELRKGLVFGDTFYGDGGGKADEDIIKKFTADDLLIIDSLKNNGWCGAAAVEFYGRYKDGRLPDNSEEAAHIKEAQARVAAAEKVKRSLKWEDLYNKPESLTADEIASLPSVQLSGVLRNLMRQLTGAKIKAFRTMYAIYQTRTDRDLPVSVKSYESNKFPYMGAIAARY